MVRALNISRNQIASDLKMFRMMQKFLNCNIVCNKVLETLNLSFCNINDKAGAMIGKEKVSEATGFCRRSTLILKGNPIKEGGVSSRSLERSSKTRKPSPYFTLPSKSSTSPSAKFLIESEHITQEFYDTMT